MYRNDVDVQLRLALELCLVRERLEANLVKGIGRVGDELSEENLLVGVEGIDDQRK